MDLALRDDRDLGDALARGAPDLAVVEIDEVTEQARRLPIVLPDVAAERLDDVVIGLEEHVVQAQPVATALALDRDHRVVIVGEREVDLAVRDEVGDQALQAKPRLLVFVGDCVASRRRQPWDVVDRDRLDRAAGPRGPGRRSRLGCGEGKRRLVEPSHTSSRRGVMT